jgi:hypothetical protein
VWTIDDEDDKPGEKKRQGEQEGPRRWIDSEGIGRRFPSAFSGRWANILQSADAQPGLIV